MNPVLFNLSDLVVIRSEVLLTVFAGIVLAFGLMGRMGKRLAGHLAIVLAVVVLAVVVLSWNAAGAPVSAFSGAFVVDHISQFFKIAFLISLILSMGMSVRLLEQDGAEAGEYFVLMILATVGMMFMASGLDLLIIWLGLELLSLSSYVLCGFLKQNRKSSEAALKYFLLGAFSSGILLYGISLIYGTTGSTLLPAIHQSLVQDGVPGPLFHLGVVLLVAGFGFKIAAVPFHQWAPDVYEGAPTGITAFISTASKAAAFAALLRILTSGFWIREVAGTWVPLLVVLAAASMVFGNIAALMQENVKRMLAYSSIGHAGYILMGLVAMGESTLGDGAGNPLSDPAGLYRFGAAAVLVYVLVYTFTNVGAFGIIACLHREDRSGERIADFRGLSRRNPLLSLAMMVFLLSLGGIPATAGFVGKWYLFGAAVSARYAWLAVVAVVMSTVSIYYYLRVVVSMYMTPSGKETAVRIPGLLAMSVAIAVVFTLLLGIYPGRFLELAAQGAAQLQLISWGG